MIRQLLKNDVPEKWRIRAKAGLCPVCGKDPSEFAKGMKVYCSKKCREEYAKKYTWWVNLREKILQRDNHTCQICGINTEKIKKTTDDKTNETIKKLIQEEKEIVNTLRGEFLLHLSERYETEYNQIMDDENFFKNYKWRFPQETLKKYKLETWTRYPNLSLDVDHIKAIVNGGDEWDENNLRTLCQDCHIKKTKTDMKIRTLKKTKSKELEI